MTAIASTGRTRAWPVWAGRIAIPRAAAPFLILLIAVIWGVFVSAVQLSYPYTSEYGEAITLAGAVRMVEGGLGAGYAYNDVYYQAPVLSYPPVFPMLVATLYTAGLPLLLAGRLLALFSCMAISVLLALLVRQEGAPRWLVLACLALPFGCFPFFMWSTVARVDALALVFSLSGYYLVTSGSRTVGNSIARLNGAPGILRLCAAALCFALAFSTKQSMVAAFATVILAGLLTKGHRLSSVVLAGLAAVGALLVLAGMQAVTGGDYLDIITAERDTDFSVVRMLGFYAMFTAVFGALVLLGALAWYRPGWSGATFHRRALLCYWPLTFVVAGTTGKLGSADYYLMELTVATIVLAAAGYTRLISGELGSLATWARRWPLLRAAIAVQAICLAVSVVVSGAYLFQNRVTRPAFKHAITYLAADGSVEVFSDNPGMLLSAGRHDQVYDGFLYRLSYEDGSEQGAMEAADMTEGRWDVLVLSFDPSVAPDGKRIDKRWPPELLSAVRQNYHMVETVSDARGRTRYYVLEPKY